MWSASNPHLEIFQRFSNMVIIAIVQAPLFVSNFLLQYEI